MACNHLLGTTHSEGGYVCSKCGGRVCPKDADPEWNCLLDYGHDGPCENRYIDDPKFDRDGPGYADDDFKDDVL